MKAKELLHCPLKPMKLNQIDYVGVEHPLRNTQRLVPSTKKVGHANWWATISVRISIWAFKRCSEKKRRADWWEEGRI